MNAKIRKFLVCNDFTEFDFIFLKQPFIRTKQRFIFTKQRFILLLSAIATTKPTLRKIKRENIAIKA
ncbi:MAG: hypothetical protein LBL74_05025 [Bacteroidales bacterium]|nr:hypothetical protein [Bacteroidales bacterium]